MEEILLRLVLLGVLGYLIIWLIPMEEHIRKIVVVVLVLLALLIALPLLRQLFSAVLGDGGVSG